MNWYYEKNAAAFGPVSEVQLDAAKLNGEVDAYTQVLCEGWTAWRTAGEVWPSMLGTAPPLPAYLLDPYNSDAFFDGPWRHGNVLVMKKGVPLGHACLKCGDAATTRLPRTLAWHHPALYLLIFAGLILYLILGLVLRQTASVHIPLCAACDARRKRNLGIGWAIFLVSVALLVAGGSVIDDHDTLGGALLIAGGVLLLVSAIWAAAVQLVTVQRMDGSYVWIRKAGQGLLGQLPPWQGK
jgi:phosphate starvation-inducible membrane PsiE